MTWWPVEPFVIQHVSGMWGKRKAGLVDEEDARSPLLLPKSDLSWLGPSVYYCCIRVNHMLVYEIEDILESHLCYMTMCISNCNCGFGRFVIEYVRLIAQPLAFIWMLCISVDIARWFIVKEIGIIMPVPKRIDQFLVMMGLRTVTLALHQRRAIACLQCKCWPGVCKLKLASKLNSFA